MADDIADFDDDGKIVQLGPHKIWMAVAVDIFDHQVVGASVKIPGAENPKKQAWAPMIVWLWMITKAQRKEFLYIVGGRSVQLQRGQLVLTERHLAHTANWSRKAARLFLLRLRQFGMIDMSYSFNGAQLSFDLGGQKKGPTLNVVTICNYDVYQYRLHAQGTKKGPKRDQEPTCYRDTVTKKGTSSRSLTQNNYGSDAREAEAGTNGASDERLPFSKAALAECEKLGFQWETVVKRYGERTKGKRIEDPSAYLVEMAVQMAAKARGTTRAAMRAVLSKNTGERVHGYAEATGAARQPSDKMREIVSRRVKRAGRSPADMLQAWQKSVAGATLLNPDQNLDSFCSRWLKAK